MCLRPLGSLKVTLAKGEPMQPEITINDYPCGSGKTTAMINLMYEFAFNIWAVRKQLNLGAISRFQ